MHSHVDFTFPLAFRLAYWESVSKLVSPGGLLVSIPRIISPVLPVLEARFRLESMEGNGLLVGCR